MMMPYLTNSGITQKLGNSATLRLNTLKELLRNKQVELNYTLGLRAQILEDISVYQERIKDNESSLARLEQVFSILQELEKNWHKTYEDRLSQLITKGLSRVFEEPIEFVLIQKTYGDLSSMDFELKQKYDNGYIQTPILNAKGGGVIAVVAFLLRVILLLSTPSNLRPILILDETFAHVSDEYLPNLAQLIRQLVDDTELQVVLVTHQPLFAEYADMSYEASLNSKGESEYKLLHDMRKLT